MFKGTGGMGELLIETLEDQKHLAETFTGTSTPVVMSHATLPSPSTG